MFLQHSPHANLAIFMPSGNAVICWVAGNTRECVLASLLVVFFKGKPFNNPHKDTHRYWTSSRLCGHICEHHGFYLSHLTTSLLISKSFCVLLWRNKCYFVTFVIWSCEWFVVLLEHFKQNVWSFLIHFPPSTKYKNKIKYIYLQ